MTTHVKKPSPTSLDFKPVGGWPAPLPTMSWGRWQLTHFQNLARHNYDLSQGGFSFEEVFFSLYPRLTLSELARIYTGWPESFKSEVGINWTLFFENYRLNYNSTLIHTLETLASTPEDFQNWVSLKGLSIGDLAPLLSVPNDLDLTALYSRLSVANPSKSIGVQILEWMIELSLMGHEIPHISPSPMDANEWWQLLKSLRYNNTVLLDNTRSHATKSLPWPSHTQAQWQRRGDEGGIDVRFFVTSEKDLEQKIKGLMKVQEKIQTNSDGLWKS